MNIIFFRFKREQKLLNRFLLKINDDEFQRKRSRGFKSSELCLRNDDD